MGSGSCVEACCSDARCMALTFVPSQPVDMPPCTAGQPCCWLKSAATPDQASTIPGVASTNVTRWTVMVDIEVVVDNTVVEVYVDGGAAVLTLPVFPTVADVSVIDFVAQGAQLTVTGTQINLANEQNQRRSA